MGSSSSFWKVSNMRNWFSYRQSSDVSKPLNSMMPSIERTTNLLVPEDIHGRVVLYDVFISHRGSDAKKHAATFHDEFEKLGVKSFLDTEGIFKGENLSAIIVEAISSSTVLLVILSKGFAESPWCLEELKLMLERIKEEKNRVVLIPVFFGVEPEDLRDVRRPQGPFFKAFQEHEEGKEFSSWAIKKWEEALKEVSDIPGSKLSDFKGKKDDLIKTVVQNVVKIVQDVDLEIAKFPVSVDEKVRELNDLIIYSKSLQDSPCVLGIVGMPGIGKTTVAKLFFNTFRSDFNSACFIDGVSVKEKATGLASIQKIILKELVLLDDDVCDVNNGVKLLKKRLQGLEVLLVLDDIDDPSQLEALMVQEVLSQGSVILVTTTDGGLLKEIQNILYYEMKKLDKCESKELLLMHATEKRELIYPELDTIVEEYLDICDGLPLSLEVIGRSLNGSTNKFIWKNSLAKVCDILPSEIKRKFQSYFENMDQVEKDVLVDVACFFDVEEDYDLAICFWDATGITGEKVINDLVLKCAISFNGTKLSIHPQMKQYIMEAVDENNRKYPTHKTHLWQPREVQKAMCQSPGLVNLEYLSLAVKGSKGSLLPDLNGIPRSKITWKEYDNDILGPWPTDCFSYMSKLKFLKLEDDCVVGSELNNLPSGILWLQWRFYPYGLFHDELPISNLWILELEGGELSALWETKEHAEIPLQLRQLRLQGCVNLESLPTSIGMLIHLQCIVLKGCKALTFLPDEICNAQSLNSLDLSGCRGLQSLPSSIGNLKNMQFLDLSGCVKLLCLPNSFSELIHLLSLDLSGCINLRMVPRFSRTMKELRHLDLLECGFLVRGPPTIVEIPDDHINDVLELNLLLECGFLVRGPEASPTIVEIPDHINDVLELTNLQILKLSVGENLPSGFFEQLSSLMILYIKGPGLVDLPWSLGDLSALVTLILDGCSTLNYLVQSIGKLRTLKNLKFSSCGLIELPKEIGELCNLEVLCIHYCKSLTTLPSTISNLSMILKFELVGNSRLSVSHESFSNMSLLRELVIDGCEVSDESLFKISKYCHSLTHLKLQGLPISGFKIMEDELPNLVWLSIFSCNSLVTVEIFSKLRVLIVASCLHLKSVVVPRGIPMWLRELTLNHCPELSVVQSVDMLQHLEKIDTVGCTNLHYIQDLELVQTLKEMHIFITYWGFNYHGDEWLQKLQRYIYAPAMHFATKTVYNKDELFENFQKMEEISCQSLTFQLPESTVPCAWLMVAFLSHDEYHEAAESIKYYDQMMRGDPESEEYKDFLLPREGNIDLTLFDGKKPMTTIHEYKSAEVGDTIHFSIFTGDFWLCEQLRTGRTINISSNSYETLQSGWVRMLSIEEESNIEAIQSEFFERLRAVKEADLRVVAQAEEYFYSMLLERRSGTTFSHIEPIESEEEEVREEQVREILDLKMDTRSAADMRNFLALDVANCTIVRIHFHAEVAIQAESLAPVWKKVQALFIQDHVESLSHLQLEISKACRNLANSLAVCSHNTTLLQVTVREDGSFPGIISHEFDHFDRSEEQRAADEIPTKFSQVVLEHHQYMKQMVQRYEEVREEQVGEILDLKMDTRSAADMRNFLALDVANCTIVRIHFHAEVAIQAESLAPVWKKVQALFIQDHVESLSHLQLEISKACRNLANSLVVCSHNTFLQVTVREDGSFPGIINHEFDHFDRSEEQRAADEIPTKFSQVVLEHHQYMKQLVQRYEKVQLRVDMGKRIQFFADDENGFNIFIPDVSDDGESDYQSAEDGFIDWINSRQT